jgi:hypothetical protein
MGQLRDAPPALSIGKTKNQNKNTAQKHRTKTKCLAAWLFQGLSFFAIETKAKVGYITTAPQGVEVCEIFENSAASNWQPANSQTKPKITILQPVADSNGVEWGKPDVKPGVEVG